MNTSVCLTDWLTDCLTDWWLIEWVSEWVSGWVSNWVIDWLVGCFKVHQHIKVISDNIISGTCRGLYINVKHVSKTVTLNWLKTSRHISTRRPPESAQITWSHLFWLLFHTRRQFRTHQLYATIVRRVWKTCWYDFWRRFVVVIATQCVSLLSYIHSNMSLRCLWC